MRKITVLLLLTLYCLQAMPGNRETKTIQSGGHEREYLLYVPEKHSENSPSGLIVCLHGFNRTMDDFFDNYNIAELAETLNMIVLAPQALPENSNDVLRLINLIPDFPLTMEAVWGCGLKVEAKVPIPIINGTIDVVLNAGVDDVAFIHHIISETEKNHNIIPENKFLFGTSMGGYMSYQYALYHGNDLSGLINICGSMGTAIRNAEAAVKLPICDFHSIDDEVVPYAGPLKIDFGALKIEATLCKDKEDVINFWVNKNGASTDPIVENLSYYPPTTGYSVTKYTYPGDNEVIHYKMSGSTHSYFYKKETDCMDYVEEVAKFIAANSKATDTGNTAIAQQKPLTIYPSPAVGPMVNLNIEQGQFAIYSLNGQIVLSGTFQDGTVNIGTLSKGIYMISVTTGTESHQGKLIVR